MTYTQHEIDRAVTDAHTKFSGREAYFKWVSEWKANYKELSINIKVQKKLVRSHGDIFDWKESQKLSDLKSNARTAL
jgi:hypothetical protein